ncbi:HAD-IIB family hydrolase [Roseomonas stagni]|uniref:HAD-IIB family hydrolase n=1 Tax=Falsiroseomonas algicola TaxID=2716930 RepID=A0A6M1LFL8_9PROT|nr:HAD-IIB family hydrolase [Falsiroseomonas algicola]NGM18991.1 HAD-IIB family hydrolase [Falsiroseomonas algicola]
METPALSAVPHPAPLSEAAPAALAGLRWVLADIDDTITTEGRLEAAAYTALERLRDAGIAVVPVTGRPAGWCDMIARFWPVAAVVGENGALWYSLDHAGRRMRRWQAQTEPDRLARRATLDALAAQALTEVPGSAIAADQAFRLFDVAVDFAEDVGPLEAGAAERIAAIFHAGGAAAKVSSIHVNAWMGEWDKRAGVENLFATLWEPLDEVLDRVAFLGDSPNDAPMFGRIPLSVGVANVAPFLPGMATPPAYIARRHGGAGFVEFTEAVIAARNNPERKQHP